MRIHEVCHCLILCSTSMCKRKWICTSFRKKASAISAKTAGIFQAVQPLDLLGQESPIIIKLCCKSAYCFEKVYIICIILIHLVIISRKRNTNIYKNLCLHLHLRKLLGPFATRDLRSRGLDLEELLPNQMPFLGQGSILGQLKPTFFGGMIRYDSMEKYMEKTQPLGNHIIGTTFSSDALSLWI